MRLSRQKVLNLIPYSQLTLEAIAVGEVHVLHALGEHDLVDSTCGREGEEREKDKVRNEEARAAGRQNVLNKYDHHSSSKSAVPVMPLHSWKFTLCMPSGSTILSTAPAKGKAKRGKRIK